MRFPITLGQFLKVAQLAASGGEAKMLIAEGAVRVNREVDMRRGRKLVGGDVVQVGRLSALVVGDDEGPPPVSGESFS